MQLRDNLGKYGQRDVTFGLTARFWKKRAIFKKTTSNESGAFAFPKVESDALDLRIDSLINMVAIIPTRENPKFTTIEALSVRKDADGFFNFTFPESKADELNVNRETLAPIQFVTAKVGANQPDPTGQVRSRASFTSLNTMVWKQRVKTDPNGQKYVTIEPNEREFFDIENGRNIDLSIFPVRTDDFFAIKNSVLDNTVTAYEVSTGKGKTMRLNLPTRILPLEFNEGDIVQCIGRPV